MGGDGGRVRWERDYKEVRREARDQVAGGELDRAVCIGRSISTG